MSNQPYTDQPYQEAEPPAEPAGQHVTLAQRVTELEGVVKDLLGKHNQLAAAVVQELGL
jgi:hypothetical protein